MTGPRDTDSMMRDVAERDLTRADKVAYARQREIDPDFRSVDGQDLPDRFYSHAQRRVALGAWTQDHATAWLQSCAHARRMDGLTLQLRAEHRAALTSGAAWTRADAAFASLAKTGGASLVAMLGLYLCFGAGGVATVAPLALVLTALATLGAAVTRRVL